MNTIIPRTIRIDITNEMPFSPTTDNTIKFKFLRLQNQIFVNKREEKKIYDLKIKVS
jgi:hypothetical protein